MLDVKIFGRISFGTYTGIPKVDSDLWSEVFLTNENKNALFNLTITRAKSNSISIFGFALDGNQFAIGRLIKQGMEYSKVFNPRDYTSSVLITNLESMKVTSKILGQPWGIEPNAGYDGLINKWVDVAHFRMMNPCYMP